MATTLVNKAENELTPRAIKSASPSTFTAKNLTTSFQQVVLSDGNDINLGNNPSIAAILKWRYSAGTSLTVRIKVSNNGTDFVYAPSFGSPSTGTSVASIAEVTYSSTTWDQDGTDAWCPFEAILTGWRFAQLWIKSNDASGSILAASTLTGGTGA